MTVAEPTTKKAVTEYVVLKHWKATSSGVGPGEGWVEVARVKATNGDAAIKAAAKNEGGTYQATPARSWNPRTIKVETRQVVSLV